SKRLDDLATAMIQEYVRRENTQIAADLAKGEVYVPKTRYQMGQTLVVAALDFATGEVTDVRAGQNPEYGMFDVIKVRFSSGIREFAAGLQTDHRLNQTNGSQLLHDDAQLSADEIYDLYQDEIDESILYA